MLKKLLLVVKNERVIYLISNS